MPQTPCVKALEGNAIPIAAATADRPAGTVVSIGGQFIGIIPVDLPANQSGAAEIYGVWSFPKANVAITLGANVYWDPSGNPVGGDPGSGAITTTMAGNIFAGRAVEAVSATDSRVRVLLHPSV